MNMNMKMNSLHPPRFAETMIDRITFLWFNMYVCFKSDCADDDMWDDEASLDYRQALTLEMKRQQIQRELQQMEEEEEAREQAELILQKEVSAGHLLK